MNRKGRIIVSALKYFSVSLSLPLAFLDKKL